MPPAGKPSRPAARGAPPPSREGAGPARGAPSKEARGVISGAPPGEGPRSPTSGAARAGKVRAATVPPPRGSRSPERTEQAPPARREFQQCEGFSVLAPDKAKHADLLRRQKIADKSSRPMPTAEQLRFTEVLDPAAARRMSDREKEAARKRWVEEKQAEADPARIRQAIRQRAQQRQEAASSTTTAAAARAPASARAAAAPGVRSPRHVSNATGAAQGSSCKAVQAERQREQMVEARLKRFGAPGNVEES